MAKKIPSNFYQEVNIRKLDKVFSNEGDIPTPSVSDEGKVLKVDNTGKYKLLPDGGAQTMTVAITYDETTEEYSADKTHADIVAALNAGVIVKATYSDLTFVYAGTNKPSSFDGVYFTYIQADSEDQLLCKCFEIDVDDRIVFSSHDISEELPVVDSSDNGAYLEVVNGVWSVNKLTLNSVIPERNHAILAYISGITNGTYYIDLKDRVNFIVDKARLIDTSNLKVTVKVNNKTIANNENYDDVFSTPFSPFQISTIGGISALLQFKPTYNALIPAGTPEDCLVYLRFMSDITIGAELT